MGQRVGLGLLYKANGMRKRGISTYLKALIGTYCGFVILFCMAHFPATAHIFDATMIDTYSPIPHTDTLLIYILGVVPVVAGLIVLLLKCWDALIYWLIGAELR